MAVATPIRGRSRTSSTAGSNSKELAILLFKIDGLIRSKFRNGISTSMVEGFENEFGGVGNAGLLHDLRCLDTILLPFFLNLTDKNDVNFLAAMFYVTQLIHGAHIFRYPPGVLLLI